VQTSFHLSQFASELGAAVGQGLAPALQPRRGLLDGPLQQALVESLSDRVEHDLVEPVLADLLELPRFSGG